MAIVSEAPLEGDSYEIVTLRLSLIALDCVLRKGAQSNWSGKQARICVLCDAFCSHTARGGAPTTPTTPTTPIWREITAVGRGLAPRST